MFTPPPSPIPPKRQILPVPEDTPAVAISSQPQPKPAKRRRRGAFVVLVPLILLFIVATARQLIQDDPRVEWIGSLRKRQTDNNGTPTVVPDLQLTTGGATGTATSVGSSPSSSGRPSSTSQTPPAIQDPPLPVPTPFPQPFDVILSFNFSTESCQSFFVDFTRALTFRQCRAFSLLVSSSSAFYEAQANLTTLTAIVGGTCNAPDTPEHCKQVMDDYSRQLESVCAKDMQDRNALVVEAYNGFKSYSMFHEAGCLRNLRTNSYCFVDAAASESPADMYYFTLPIGVPLPKSTVPSCTACTQSVLAVYAEYATNSSLKISETYPEAARRAAGVCGQQYATLVGAAVRSHPIAWGAMAVSLTLAVWALIG